MLLRERGNFFTRKVRLGPTEQLKCRAIELMWLLLSHFTEGLLQQKLPLYEFGNSCHSSTEDWLHARKEIIWIVIGLGNSSYFTGAEVRKSDVWRNEEEENQRVYRQRRNANIKEEETFANKTFTPFYPRIRLLFLFFSVYLAFYCWVHPTTSWEINIESTGLVAVHCYPDLEILGIISRLTWQS